MLLTFFFNDPATTEIYTLSLHDALPISAGLVFDGRWRASADSAQIGSRAKRSEEHTSELQSHHDLVCRLLLEKKKKEDKSDENDQQQQDIRGHPRLIRLRHHRNEGYQCR